MNIPSPLKNRISGLLNLDRAVRFVWQAAPKWTVVNGLLLLVQGVLPLAGLYVMKLLIDAVTLAVTAPDKAHAFTHIGLLIGLALAVALLTALFQLLGQFSGEAQSLAATDHVTTLIHEKSVTADLAYYEDPAFFDTLHRAQEEGAGRPTHIVNGLIQLGQSSISLISMAALLLSFHPLVAMILFITVLPGILVRIRFSEKMHVWQGKNTPKERRANYYGWILTGDRHAKEVRVFDLGSLFSGRYQRLKGELREEKLAITRKRALADFFAQALASLVVFATFGYIAWRAITQTITLGDMVMYFQAFQRGLGYLKELLGGMADLYEDTLFIRHLYAFLDIEPQVTDPADPVPFPQDIREGISLDHVHFSYPSANEVVLDDVSFHIRPGEVVALVGENGSGKSTLVKLLLRLYDPLKGSIRIDGTDVRKFRIKDLREHISVIFQDFVHYHLSAAENVGLGYSQAKENKNRIESASKKAGAHDLISRLPHGYDTMLGKWIEPGTELSQGQWQKIALARAFMRNAKLIVLDEPTSSLDAKTEFAVFSTFKRLLEGRSAILISHRFSTVRMADRIIVLEKGKIIENGSHEWLMAKQGVYAEWFDKQAKGYR